MIYVLLGMSLLFVAIGFIVTEKNAKYLLGPAKRGDHR